MVNNVGQFHPRAWHFQVRNSRFANRDPYNSPRWVLDPPFSVGTPPNVQKCLLDSSNQIATSFPELHVIIIINYGQQCEMGGQFHPSQGLHIFKSEMRLAKFPTYERKCEPEGGIVPLSHIIDHHWLLNFSHHLTNYQIINLKMAANRKIWLYF